MFITSQFPEFNLTKYICEFRCHNSRGEKDGFLGPMNPTKKRVYAFLEAFFEEITQVFPDKYLHLGGDEVDFKCW